MTAIRSMSEPTALDDLLAWRARRINPLVQVDHDLPANSFRLGDAENICYLSADLMDEFVAFLVRNGRDVRAKTREIAALN